MSNWQPVHQQSNQIDILMESLSINIHCTVRHLEPIYGKPVFECICLKTFPIFAVQAAYDNDKWDDIIKRHNGEL